MNNLTIDDNTNTTVESTKLYDDIEFISASDDYEFADFTDSSDDDSDTNASDIIGTNKNKKLKKLKKALLITLTTIVALVLILTVTLFVMRHMGKNNLYGAASSQAPNFNRDNIADNNSNSNSNSDGNGDNELIIDPDNIGDMSNLNNNSSENSNVNSENENSNSSSSQTDSSSNDIQPADPDAGYDILYKGKKYVYNKDILTHLILGIDKKTPVAPAKDGLSGGQSDAIFLIVMNPHTMKIDIIAIPRDTISKVWIYDIDGNFVQTGKTQICLQHGYGDGMELSNERALKAVSYLMYDLPIHSVTSINMGAVGKLNDAVGGVTLESLHTFNCSSYSFIQGKTVTLKGDIAYDYVHYRDITRHNTASERLERQKQYINLFMKQTLASIKKDLGNVKKIYNIIDDYVVSNLSLDELVYLGSEAISYELGEFISLKGQLDTSKKYERYYLDEAALQELIIQKFYEEVK